MKSGCHPKSNELARPRRPAAAPTTADGTHAITTCRTGSNSRFATQRVLTPPTGNTAKKLELPKPAKALARSATWNTCEENDE